MYSLVVWESVFIPCIFPIGVQFIDDQSMRIQKIKIKNKKKSKKRKRKKEREKAQWHVCVWCLAPLGIYITFWGLFTRYICHCGFLWDFYMSFHSLSHFCYAFGVLRVHVRVLWYPMLIGSWLICIRYERWVIFLLGSPDHCFIHHSIIGDMGQSSSILLSHCLILYPITSFRIFIPPFIYSLHIDRHF